MKIHLHTINIISDNRVLVLNNYNDNINNNCQLLVLYTIAQVPREKGNSAIHNFLNYFQDFLAYHLIYTLKLKIT